MLINYSDDAEINYKKMILNNLLEQHVNSLIKKELPSGMVGTLVYGFGRKKADILDDSVYLCEDGFVRYEILDEDAYLKYKPEANIENKYTKIPLEEFLSIVESKQLTDFFRVSENIQFNLKKLGLMKWQ